MTRPLPRRSLAALVAFVPALALVTAGLLQTASGHEVVALPSWLIHPALVVGGLALGVALALTEAAGLSVDRAADALTLHLTVRRRPLALAALGLAVALGAVIVLYLVAENVLS